MITRTVIMTVIITLVVIFLNFNFQYLTVFYTNADQFLNKHNKSQMFITGNMPDIILISEVLPSSHIVILFLLQQEYLTDYSLYCKA